MGNLNLKENKYEQRKDFFNTKTSVYPSYVCDQKIFILIELSLI